MFKKNHYIQSILSKDGSGRYRYYLENCERFHNLRGRNMPSFIVPVDGISGGTIIEILPPVNPNRTSPDLTIIPSENRGSNLLLGNVNNAFTYPFELYQDSRLLQTGHNLVQTEFAKLPRLFETRYFWNNMYDTKINLMGFALTNKVLTGVTFSPSLPSLVVSVPDLEISLFSGLLQNDASTIIHKKNNNGSYENIPNSIENTYQTSAHYIRLACDGDTLWFAKHIYPSETPVWIKLRSGITSNLYYGYYFQLNAPGTIIFQGVENGS